MICACQLPVGEQCPPSDADDNLFNVDSVGPYGTFVGSMLSAGAAAKCHRVTTLAGTLL